MERLTERDPYWMGEEFWTSAKEPDEEEIDAVYVKLWKYENAEEDGRLLELPCKVGSTVLVDLKALPFIDMEYSEEEQPEIPKFILARAVSYRKNSKTTFIKIAVRANWLSEWLDPETGPDSAYYEKERYFSFPISAIGKTLFLSEEAAKAAEAALKEMEGRA